MAFDLLVEACPSYWAADRLDGYLAAFEDAGEPHLFIRISAFSHHLIELMTGSDLTEVQAVFETVEHLLTEGDADTIELVELGLLESLQNIVSHDDLLIGPERVAPLLGPKASRVWV